MLAHISVDQEAESLLMLPCIAIGPDAGGKMNRADPEVAFWETELNAKPQLRQMVRVSGKPLLLRVVSRLQLRAVEEGFHEEVTRE